MEGTKLRIAIISDLHCHPKRTKEEGADCTYLLTDKLRNPVNDHPVESLLKVIRDWPIEVNLTLCPGDFTDKANTQGFIDGWSFSLEINQKLNSDNIIATLGNHDVDSHNSFSNYSLSIAKGIKRGFPLEIDSECDTFWSKGCVFVEKENYRVLVINSSHFHYNKLSAKSGQIDNDLIDYVHDYLKDKKDNKIQIAMSHHHPIDHSRFQLGEEDKIVNADGLLDVLGIYQFDLFIHGHKHDPLLRYFKTTKTNYQLTIFSAGSFSSTSNLMFTGMRNFFHVIEITKDKKAKGVIDTWTFIPNKGWEINNDEHGFATRTGFGNDHSLEEIFASIKLLLENHNFMNWDEVITTIPDISHLIPADSKTLSDMLDANGYKLSAHIWKKGQQIFNLNRLNPSE